jgi:hypothetical protein
MALIETLRAQPTLKPVAAISECRLIDIAFSVVFSSLMFFSLAVWNGYPFVFTDTPGYFLQAVGAPSNAFRPNGYPMIMSVMQVWPSLWLAAAIQCLAFGLVVTGICRLFASSLRPWMVVALSAFLAYGTSAGYHATFMVPDAFTGLIVLIVAGLVVFNDRLNVVRAIAGWMLVGLLASSHFSHLPLMLALIVMGSALGLWLHRSARLSGQMLLGAVLALAQILSVFMMMSWGVHKQISLSPTGPTFVFARLYTDGVAKEYMDQHCESLNLQLCQHKSKLKQDDIFILWRSESPLVYLRRKEGDFTRLNNEAAQIIAGTIKTDPLGVAQAMATNAVRQFASFDTFDAQYPETWSAQEQIFWFMSTIFWHENDAFMSSRQMLGLHAPDQWNKVHGPVSWLSLALLFPLAWLCLIKGRRDLAAFLVLVATAIAANALACGALSGVYDRYQSRIVWLAPFAVLVSVAGRWPRLRDGKP